MDYIADKLMNAGTEVIKYHRMHSASQKIFVETAEAMFANDLGNTSQDQALRLAFSKNNIEEIHDALQNVSQIRWGEEIYLQLKRVCTGLEIPDALSNLYIRRYIEQLCHAISAEYPAEYQGFALGETIKASQQQVIAELNPELVGIKQQLQKILVRLSEGLSETEEETIPFTVPVNDTQWDWELSDHEVNGIHGTEESWPMEVRNLTNSWKQERRCYPGWYIMPVKEAYELKLYTRTMGLCSRLKQMVDKGSLALDEAMDFVYEYVWRCANSMYPVYLADIQGIYAIWSLYQKRISRKGDVSEEQLANWYMVGSFLLMQYRHRMEKRTWERIYTAMKEYTNKLGQQAEEWEVTLWYENVCMLFMEFHLYQVLEELKAKEIPERFYFIRLQVAGLYAELGEDEKAYSGLESLEADIQRGLTAELTREDETFRLSLLAACEKLHTLLLTADMHCRQEEEFAQLQNERQKHKDVYETNQVYFSYAETVYRIEEDFLAAQYSKQEHEKKAFDPDRETVTLVASPDICEESYYLYQMLTKCGIPMKIKCMVLIGSRTEYYMKDGLMTIYPMLGLHMLLRGSSTKHIELLIDNCYLAGEEMPTLTKQFTYIVDALSCNVSAFRYHRGWKKQNVYSSLLENGLELVLRYAARSSDEMQPQLIALFIQMVKEDCITEHGKLDQVIYRLFHQIPESVKAAHLKELMDVRLPVREARFDRSNPLDIFSVLQKKDLADVYYDAAVIDEEQVDELLGQAEEEGQRRQVALSRLQFLYRHHLLTPEQERSYREQLWADINEETGLPNVQDYYLKSFLYMPYEDKGQVVQAIKGVLLAQNITEEPEDIAESDEMRIRISEHDNLYLEELRLFNLAIADEEALWWSEEEQQTLNEHLHRLEHRLEMYLPCLLAVDRYTEIRVKEQHQKLQLAKLSLMKQETIQYRAEDMEPLYEQMYDKTTFREAVNICYHRLANHMLDEKTAKACLSHLICQMRAMNRAQLPAFLCTFHNLFYSGAVQWQEEHMTALDRLLIQISREVTYDTCTSEQEVKETIIIRRCSADLAYQMYRYEGTCGMPLTAGVVAWQRICEGDEFNDVRNAWVVS